MGERKIPTALYVSSMPEFKKSYKEVDERFGFERPSIQPFY